jgi:hypothetical protein
MNWNESANYGVIKIDGSTVKLYRATYTYENLYVGRPVDRAVWMGNALVVYLQDGTTRRYSDWNNYQTTY